MQGKAGTSFPGRTHMLYLYGSLSLPAFWGRAGILEAKIKPIHLLREFFNGLLKTNFSETYFNLISLFALKSPKLHKFPVPQQYFIIFITVYFPITDCDWPFWFFLKK